VLNFKNQNRHGESLKLGIDISERSVSRLQRSLSESIANINTHLIPSW